MNQGCWRLLVAIGVVVGLPFFGLMAIATDGPMSTIGTVMFWVIVAAFAVRLLGSRS